MASGTPASRYTKALRFRPAIQPPLETLAVYILNTPNSLHCLSYDGPNGTVDYRAKSSTGHPMLADDASHKDPQDLLAAIIPTTSPIKGCNWFAISDGTPTETEKYPSMHSRTHST
jgi:hypothetical protein